MTVASSQIGWGRYAAGGREGPIFSPRQGAVPYRPPSNPTFNDKIMMVGAATEGGAPGAVNMYDVCDVTVGLLQACERSGHLVASMLGAVKMRDAVLLRPLEDVGVRVVRNEQQAWRFAGPPGMGVCETPEQLRALCYGGASGRVGEWSDPQKAQARTIAAALATVLEQAPATTAQMDWWGPRLRGFAAGKLRSAVDAVDRERQGDAIGQAFVCGALSFAGNNPLRARLAYEHAIVQPDCPAPWTLDWLVHCLRWFVKGPPTKPSPAIYPHRYAAIRPVLERLFGIDLPDNADELAGLMPADEVQWILVHVLGYDIGPGGPNGDGVDNKWGEKSRAALLDFERREGITGPDLDGMPDRHTCDLLARKRDAWRNDQGKVLEGGPVTVHADGSQVPPPPVQPSEPEVPLSTLLAQAALLWVEVPGFQPGPGWRTPTELDDQLADTVPEGTPAPVAKGDA